jgi:hypothetical protein
MAWGRCRAGRPAACFMAVGPAREQTRGRPPPSDVSTADLARSPTPVFGVDILGCTREPVRADRQPADQDVLDTAVGQCGDQLIWREHPGRGQDSLRAPRPGGSVAPPPPDARPSSARDPGGDPRLSPRRCDGSTPGLLPRPALGRDRTRRPRQGRARRQDGNARCRRVRASQYRCRAALAHRLRWRLRASRSALRRRLASEAWAARAAGGAGPPGRCRSHDSGSAASAARCSSASYSR